jgi:hypothetical protein
MHGSDVMEERTVIGIDISKTTLVVAVQPSGESWTSDTTIPALEATARTLLAELPHWDTSIAARLRRWSALGARQSVYGGPRGESPHPSARRVLSAPARSGQAAKGRARRGDAQTAHDRECDD